MIFRKLLFWQRHEGRPFNNALSSVNNDFPSKFKYPPRVIERFHMENQTSMYFMIIYNGMDGVTDLLKLAQRLWKDYRLNRDSSDIQCA